MLLLEHDVPHSNFSQAVLSFLPKMPWTITEEVSTSPWSVVDGAKYRGQEMVLF